MLHSIMYFISQTWLNIKVRIFRLNFIRFDVGVCIGGDEFVNDGSVRLFFDDVDGDVRVYVAPRFGKRRCKVVNVDNSNNLK